MSMLSARSESQRARDTCRRLLPRVSRTFALNIPVLREPLRTEVGVAYLLCRIADTIEDRADLDPSLRDELFSELLDLATRAHREPAGFGDRWPEGDEPAHDDLMQHAGEVMVAFGTLGAASRVSILLCLGEMVSGMRRYPPPASGRLLTPCATLLDLEDYCHVVAGTVGHLLSDLFAQHLDEGWLTPELRENGRRFGLGLQITNVLKDDPRDRERGISYLPTQEKETSGTVRALIHRALDHLDRADGFVRSIPLSRTDLRTFCLWAQHLALATLRVLTEADPTRRKIQRPELWSILARTRVRAGNDSALVELHRRARGKVLDSLQQEGATG